MTKKKQTNMNAETYKYYLFFRITEDDEEGDLVEPYAYTNSRKYAKRFMEERDMKKFIMEKKYLTREQLNALVDDYQTRVMMKMEGNTYSYIDGTLKKISYSYIVSQTERSHVYNYGFAVGTTYLMANCFVNPDIFNDEIREALYRIHYKECHDFVKTGYNPANRWSKSFSFSKEQMEENLTIDEYMETIKPDYFSVFVNLYGSLLKYY